MTVAPTQRLADLEGAAFRADQRLERIEQQLAKHSGVPVAVADILKDQRDFRQDTEHKLEDIEVKLNRVEALVIALCQAQGIDPDEALS